jgi:hypothetical protein
MASANQPHGTRARYRTCKAGLEGKKCDLCKEANSAYHREYNNKRKMQNIPDNVQHGLESTYVHWHCHCELCYLAKQLSKEKRRKKKMEGKIKNLRNRSLLEIVKDAQKRIVEAHKAGVHAAKLNYCPLCNEEEDGKANSS